MTVHASPTYRIRPAGPPPPGYPTAREAQAPGTRVQVLGTSEVPGTFDERRAAYLAHCLATPAPENTKGIYHELVRLAAVGATAGSGPIAASGDAAAGPAIHEGVIAATLDYIEARHDCADFSLHGVLRLLYQFGDHPALSRSLVERCRQTVLGFKYWPDEPGRPGETGRPDLSGADSMCTWTENHHILFASAAFLAGQMFPQATFSNSGRTGAEQMVLHGPRIRRWLDLRFRTGFSEWLSHVYYDEDLAALLPLVDFCADAEIATRAAMVIDLLLLDIALNSHRGVFGSSHGRAYENTKKWAGQEGTTDTAQLLFGQGQWSGFDNMSAAAFALSPNYRMPAAIEAVAREAGRAPMENRQRMGIRLAEAARWGLGMEDFEDGMALLTLEAYLHPRTVGLVMRMFDAFDWWENSFFAPFKPYRRLIGFLRRTRTLPLLSRALEWDLCRNTREEVDVLTCRTPDTMLSCAQDYRPGYGGDQQHIWQATLASDAVCFTTHPARRTGPTPNYWAGSGVLPRAAQVGNVAIVVYRIHRKPALYVADRLPFTHAWLPRDRFDEVVEREGWIFARKGDGYLALRSQQPVRWQNEPGEDAGRELIAAGRANIWICEVGRRGDAVDSATPASATDPTAAHRSAADAFASFIDRICAAPVRYRGSGVVYDSPSQGRLEFGWRGPLRRNGAAVPLHDYPRYDNPYVRAEFPAARVTVFAGGCELVLDWAGMRRVESTSDEVGAS